jgi:hypothetical protein
MDQLYYIYVKPDGYPDIQRQELKLELFPGYQFLGTTAHRPDIGDRKMVNGQWVWGGSEPEYIDARRRAYPPIGDQLDALYKAMVDGVIPNVPEFRGPIDEVKGRIPKDYRKP